MIAPGPDMLVRCPACGREHRFPDPCPPVGEHSRMLPPVVETRSSLVECPHCGDVTEQQWLLPKFTCGACDNGFDWPWQQRPPGRTPGVAGWEGGS